MGWKWKVTPEMDAYIREHYDSWTKGLPAEIGEALGLPVWLVHRRATRLGVARKKQPNWTKAEIEALHGLIATSSLETIARLLGRTKHAVNLMARRRGLAKRADAYTEASLAEALGVSPAWVASRVRSGGLRARLRGTERTEAQNGDYWYITDEAVLDYLVEHPHDIELRRVDQVWFLDLVLGALREARAQPKARRAAA